MAVRLRRDGTVIDWGVEEIHGGSPLVWQRIRSQQQPSHGTDTDTYVAVLRRALAGKGQVWMNDSGLRLLLRPKTIVHTEHRHRVRKSPYPIWPSDNWTGRAHEVTSVADLEVPYTTSDH